jgi:hypothetical protein
VAGGRDGRDGRVPSKRRLHRHPTGHIEEGATGFPLDSPNAACFLIMSVARLDHGSTGVG